MEHQAYSVEIRSPFNEVLVKEVKQVGLPTPEGRVGVLPRHERYLTPLNSGILHLYQEPHKVISYFIYEGIAAVTPKSCVISTEHFDLMDDLDIRLLEEDIRGYHNDLAGLSIEEERRILNYKISLTEAKLEALRKQER